MIFLLFSGCTGDWLAPDPLPVLDEPFFRCQVQPVLAKDCAQLLCHGDEGRYLRVYARNRLRMEGDETQRNALFAPEERAANFAAARALVEPGAPARSLLLQKPLDERAGGLYHRGAEDFGKGDVFLTASDPDYLVIASWINGAMEDPACVEPGSSL